MYFRHSNRSKSLCLCFVLDFSVGCFHDTVSNKRKENTQRNAEEYIRWEMNEEVEPPEGNDERNDADYYAGLFMP